MGHWERRSHVLFQHLQISKAAGSIFRIKSCILYDLYFIISIEENNCAFPKEGRKQEARKLSQKSQSLSLNNAVLEKKCIQQNDEEQDGQLLALVP